METIYSEVERSQAYYLFSLNLRTSVCWILVPDLKILVAKSEGSFADSKLIKKISGKKIKVFRELVKEALKVMQKEGIYMAYGFPNNLGHKSYIYGGYNLQQVNVFISNLIISD